MLDNNLRESAEPDVIRVVAHVASSASVLGAANHASYLLPARELARFRLGDRVDIRQWPVFAADERLVGAVDKLMVDTMSKKVRYLTVSLIKEAVDEYRLIAPGSVLVPIGLVQRLDDRQAIILTRITSRRLASAPRLRARAITRGDEDAALAAYGMATSREVSSPDFYKRPDFDERRLTEALDPDLLTDRLR